MVRTRVKICGLTNLEDALLAAKAGADLLGFIFAPSPRRVDPLTAATMIAKLPPLVQTVGVFVDEQPATVMAVADRCRLDFLQLSGAETPADCLLLDGRKIIKTIHVGGDGLPELELYRDHCDLLLFDTRVAGLAGGSGRTFDWQLVNQTGVDDPFMLAGGLTPDNVGQAIATVHPWAVDVSSGVEREPGRKDPEKINAFMDAVRKADDYAG
ncbi:MAG: phosphoribosylanthranilate isomerase [Deltaproteobacteria bacterium]|nr:phosphoribosylanthranilate isomerase [Candidatus Anaeroferrophillus wilburensis]MBN2888550.1 phosphoribosylanthranilate isomerase [Deltaproteobacteria bacterium]